MRASPYNYSKDAKLRISLINKFWTQPNNPVHSRFGKNPYPNNKFCGFRVIDYHSFVDGSDITEKAQKHSKLIDIKFTFDTDNEPRKMGTPNILTYNTSGFDFKQKLFGEVDKNQDIFLLTYGPECTEPIITLIISDYLFSIMLDDINLGNEIQLLDICISDKDQPYAEHCVESRSHKHFEASLPHIISFKEGWVGTGVFFGKIFNHSAISLEEFQQITGHDYVLEQTKKLYFDPEHSEHLKKHWSFDEYLQRQRDIYSKPLSP